MKPNQSNINELLAQCKKGNSKAQIHVYQQYYKAMYNSAFRILKDTFEAEDVMQEAFLNAFTKLHTFKGEVTFGAWLKRIVINKSLTQLKKNNRYEEIKMEVVKDFETEEINIDYESAGVQKVLDCINQLKDNYRLVITLNFIEGFDYEEISEILNITNENVRTTLSRAKKKLQQLLIANDIISTSYGR